MADEITVYLSTGNWERVLDSLRSDVEHLDMQLEDPTVVSSSYRIQAFVEREELLGLIEQIEDQLR